MIIEKPEAYEITNSPSTNNLFSTHAKAIDILRPRTLFFFECGGHFDELKGQCDLYDVSADLTPPIDAVGIFMPLITIIHPRHPPSRRDGFPSLLPLYAINTPPPSSFASHVGSGWSVDKFSNNRL